MVYCDSIFLGIVDTDDSCPTDYTSITVDTDEDGIDDICDLYPEGKGGET